MNRLYLVAAVSLIALAGPASAQSVRAGIEAWQRSDYAQAVAIWTPLATNGDADAQFNLGQAYRLGRGVAINLATATGWFEKAANQGHLDAETTLGLLMFQNGNQADGLKWLKKAAALGEPRALLMYGTALVNGDSVTQDPVLGYAYVSRAAEQGLQPARDTLAQLNQILPAADRKRGDEIARGLAKAVPVPVSKPIQTATKETKAPPEKPAMAVEKAAAKPVKAPPEKAVETAATEPVKAPAKEEKPAKTEAKPAPEAKTEPKAEPKAAEAAPAAKPPAKPKPAPAKAVTPTKPAAPATGNWRIQVGAFSQKGNAEAMYRKVSGKSALAGRQPFYVPVGKVTRLQVGPFESKSAAEAACRAVGGGCFPVPK